MVQLSSTRITEVHHWNDKLFSFRTTRDSGFRFISGQFIMLGLEDEKRPLMRAYSIASPHYADHLEFLSVKVPNGPLTSRLQHVQPGDAIILSRKPTGTLVLDDLNPGKHLYLLATGTGLAPFLSIIQDPETYARFEKVVLCHGVRFISDLAYHDFISRTLPQHEYLGEAIRDKLIYYPTVTREPFRHEGRLTHAIETDTLAQATGLPPLDPAHHRVMLCGSSAMLGELGSLLDARGFAISPRTRQPGDYVIERAFVDK